MSQPWLIKRQELNGSRVVDYCRSREDAEREVDSLNVRYQSDQYYVEPYNSNGAQR